MLYNTIYCGESPVAHTVPTGSNKPFTLDYSPDSESTLTLRIFGVADDYSSFWFKSQMSPETLNSSGNTYTVTLRATYEDGTYQDVVFVPYYTGALPKYYLTNRNEGWESWGYIVNSDVELSINAGNPTTTTDWINISGNTITFNKNSTDKPRLGDIYVADDTTLHIFSIIQRPDEKSDFFLANDGTTEVLSNNEVTKTVYVKSRSGKSINRWWVYVDSDSYFYYGTGDNPSFNLTFTLGSSTSHYNINGVLVVEDSDGRIWNNCCSSTLLYCYSPSGTIHSWYNSKESIDPYQDFIVMNTSAQFSDVFFLSNKTDVAGETIDKYTYIDVQAYPLGAEFHPNNSSDSRSETGFNSDFFYTNTKIFNVPLSGGYVSLTSESFCADDDKYSEKTYKSDWIGDNYYIDETIESRTGYLLRSYGMLVKTAFIPVIQTDTPSNTNTITATYNISADALTAKILGNSTPINSFEIDGVVTDISDATGEYEYTFPSEGTYVIKYTLQDNLTDLNSLFKLCATIRNIEFDCDTSNVTDMSYMFYSIVRLSNVNLEDLDTSSVVNMSFMFYWVDDYFKNNGCNALKRWNTSNVTDMSGMFMNVYSLTSIVELGNWNTSNVTDMSQMFCDVVDIISLEGLSNWDMSKVRRMYGMFTLCTNLKDISQITGKRLSPISISHMFEACRSLEVIDLTNWDLSNCSGTFGVFYQCNSLKKIYLPEFAKVGGEMFGWCEALEHIYIYDLTAPPLNESGSGYGGPFEKIKTYGTLHLRKGSTGYDEAPWTTLYDDYYWNIEYIQNVITATYNVTEDEETQTIFGNETLVSSFEIDGVVTTLPDSEVSESSDSYDYTFPTAGTYTIKINLKDNLTFLNYLFYSSDIVSVTLDCDLSNITSLEAMFIYCDKLQDISIVNFNTSNVTNMRDMFTESSYTGDIYKQFNVSRVTNFANMFSGTLYDEIDLSSWGFGTSEIISELMFAGSAIKKLNAGRLPSFEYDIIKDCSNLEEIYCYNTIAPITYSDTFTGNIRKGGTLYYPKDATGYESDYWTVLYDTYEWNQSTIDTEISLEVPVGGGTYLIEETGTWTAGETPSWISVTSDSGISLTVSQNINTSQRDASIVMTSAYRSLIINVVQSPLEVTWETRPIATLNNAGGEYSTNLNFNLKPESVVLYPDNWITANYTLYDDRLNIYGTVDSIGGVVNRSGSLYAKLKYTTSEYGTSNLIKQIGHNYDYHPTYVDIPAEGGSVTITITSDFSLSNYTSASSTYGTTVFNRISDTEIQIVYTIPRNIGDARMDAIELIGNSNVGSPYITTINQAGITEEPILYFKEKYIKLPLKGGTVYVTLVSNIDWTTKWEI